MPGKSQWIKFPTDLNPRIAVLGMTPELFDEMVCFLRQLVDEVVDDHDYKVVAVDCALLLTQNRGFYKKTLKPMKI